MNLGQLLQKVLPIQVEGRATGGGVNQVVDTSLLGKYDDATFKEGLMMIRSSASGAPQHEYSIITDYADNLSTFYLDTSFTTTIHIGDYYLVSDPQYKLTSVLRVVNDALRNFGIVSLANTTLSPANRTLQYTLPAALKAFPLDRVEVGTVALGFDILNDWEVISSVAGQAATLVFDRFPDVYTGCVFRLWYRDYHPTVAIYSDPIAETIPDKRVIDECRLALQEWLMEKNSDLSPEAMQRLGLLQSKQKESQTMNRVNVPPRKVSKFLNIGKW